MISTFDNCLFIHIPKAAGQSVESVFLKRAGIKWEDRHHFLLKKNANPKKGPPRLAHLTAQEYLKYGYLTEQEFNKLFKFTIVRNPWDRLVSEYLYKGHKYPFKDFLFKYFPKEGEDDYRGYNGIHRHVMPQSDFIVDRNGDKCVDFVGKFENINNDFAEITRLLTGEALSLPHKNKTSTSNLNFKEIFKFKKISTMKYKNFYDNESKEFVEHSYKADIKQFNYKF